MLSRQHIDRLPIKNHPIQSGQSVRLAGWVNVRRDHGGLIFIDLRDGTGVVQLVFDQTNAELFAQAQRLRPEWVIDVVGGLRERAADLQNAKASFGHLEVAVAEMRILSQAKTPPVPVHDSDTPAAEEKRLKYRYLDLRRPSLQANLKFRHRYYQEIRRFMEQAGFLEVSTPILANSSPEGARDFLVPSRLHSKKFYALPQAPQQFKQLLMVAGIPRYYQIATCFRDEDPRADRLYGDFYQLDLEMAFVEESQVVRDTVQPLVQHLIESLGQQQLAGGDFETMTYQEALRDYGTDKPDTRFGLKLQDVSAIFENTQTQVLGNVLKQGGVIQALVVEDSLSHKQLDDLIALSRQRGAAGLAPLTCLGGQWRGPLVKFLSSSELDALQQEYVAGAEETTLLLLADTKPEIVAAALDAVRRQVADWLQLADDQQVSAVWVTDFPFYEKDDSGQLAFAHNPFSKPQGDLEQADKLKITADQFDLVLNGYEVCSGAVRNHDAQSLMRAFEIVNYDKTTVLKQFGGLLKAFEYGVPPHAGCAFGLDRMLMILAKEQNIREIVAFPKNGSGVDLMMESPSDVSVQQKKELGLAK